MSSQDDLLRPYQRDVLDHLALHQTGVEAQGFGKGWPMEKRLTLGAVEDAWIVVAHSHVQPDAPYSYRARLFLMETTFAGDWIGHRHSYRQIKKPDIKVYDQGALVGVDRWEGYGATRDVPRRENVHLLRVTYPYGGMLQLRLVFQDEENLQRTRDVQAQLWGPRVLAYRHEPLAKELLEVRKQPVLWDSNGCFTIPLDWLHVGGGQIDKHTAAIARRDGMSWADFHEGDTFRDWAIAQLEEARAS